MINASDFQQFKLRPMVMVTAYDASFARIAEDAGVDVILVGDSLANVVLAKKSTREIDMRVMEIFVEAVAAGARETHITADMPFKSYEDPGTALMNARRFMELGAHSVKLEGNHSETIKTITEAGIPVIGHLGLLPQTADSLTQVGNSDEERESLQRGALDLERSGVAAIVLEHLSYDVAAQITDSLKVPTVGIGAGQGVDGQVLVMHDLLGITNAAPPPFARKFTNVYNTSLQGLSEYAEAVRKRRFP